MRKAKNKKSWLLGRLFLCLKSIMEDVYKIIKHRHPK
ncbi:MAG: hypothetical protein ACJAR8_000222 [Bacteroidia bacterium]